MTAVRLLGKRETGKFRDALAQSFGLFELSDGKSCDEARRDLPKDLQSHQSNVTSAYVAIVGTCDSQKPGTVERAIAQRYLAGLKVKS